MAIVENKTREFRFTEKDFNSLRKISNAHTGIIVTDDKYDMYYSRIVKRIRKLGFKDFSEYVAYLKANEATEFTPFIDSITTNLTSFFREKHHFDQIKSELIPDLCQRADAVGGIKIWSAGCSTGEEPYTIAMTFSEGLANKPGMKATIMASDIDTTVLSKASNGVYDIERVKGLPINIKRRWFFRGKGNNSGKVKISPELQKMMEFKQVNLMESWPMKEKFHLLFCRNVVIYFDRPTKIKLFDRFADQIVDGGFMILGHSESLQGLTDRFETIGKTVYRKIK
jgi:chemotaxis protein methyltransferase CheR